MKRIAYSYSRLSTEKQLSGHGLERQQEAIQKYVKENDLDLIDNFEDIGLSGYTGANIKIGKFGAFIRAIEDGEIDSNCTLIVESLDRLSRENVIKAQTQFGQLIETGVEIVTLIDNQTYNLKIIKESPHLMFISLATMIRANEESEVKSKRLKSAWEKKRSIAKNKIMTKIAPAWLLVADEKFEEHSSSFRTIRKIFDLSISRGMGTLAITKYLNGNMKNYPVFSSSNKWTKSYITKIVKNSSVHGELQSYIKKDGKSIKIGEPISDYYPEVINKETFQLAQQLMSKRAIGGGGRHANSFNNIFFKLLKCGNCGDTLGYFNKGKKGGNRLRCYSAHHNNKCIALSLNYEEFEKQFIDYMNEINWLPIIENVNLEKSKNTLLGKIALMKQEHQEKTIAYKNTINMISKMNEKNVSRFLENIHEQELSIDQLKDIIDELEIKLDELDTLSKTENDNEIEEIIDKVRSSSVARQKVNNHLNSIITKITVFNQPMDNGPKDQDNVHPWIYRELEKTIPTEKINHFLNDPKKLKFLSKLNMHFRVKFKSNVSKEIYPNLGTKMEWVSEYLASLHKQG